MTWARYQAQIAVLSFDGTEVTMVVPWTWVDKPVHHISTARLALRIDAHRIKSYVDSMPHAWIAGQIIQIKTGAVVG